MAEDDIEGELRGWIREEQSDYVKGIVQNALDNWAEVQDSLDDYTVEDVFLHLREEFKEQLEKFLEIQKTVDRNMRDKINLLRDNPENNQAVVKFEALKGKFKQKIKTHVNQLRAKMNQLKEASVESVQGSGDGEENGPASAQNHNTAVLRAGVKGKAVRDDVTALTEDLTYVDVYMWEEVSDVEIAKAMRKIKPWREELNRIVKSWRDLQEMATVAGIQNRPEVDETGKKVGELQALFQQVVTEVEREDLSRCLHSLDVSTGAKVSYPNFEGRDDEDWNDFEEKLKKALNDNKVRTSDKCEKLRSCLRGHARKLVPDHQKDYEAAMSALEKAFGDGNRLLNHKIDALNKLGPCPKNSDRKTGGRTTVEWYLNLETILNSLLDLGRKTDDEDIRVSVYSKKIVETVALLFPQITGMQILDCKGTGENRMKNVVEKVEELRGAAQRWGLASGGDAAAGAQTSKPAGDGGNNGRNGGGGGFNNRRSGNVKAHVSYNPPVNLPDCRVCRALEDRGDTRQLYDEHHSNYPTGCPRFIAMSTEERRKISMEAKLCLRCLDPSYKFAGLNDGRHKCLDFYNKKSRYTCPENNCKSHVWTCTRHRDNNTAVFEKFRTEIKNKTGLGFCYFIGALPFPVTQEENRGRRRSVAGNARSLRVTGATTGAVETSTGATETSTGATETSIGATESSVGATGSVTAANDCHSPPNESQSAHKTQEPSRLSSSQALSLLKKKMKGKRIRAKFRPIEKGAPQFMLGYSKGKTRPLVTLYDTGCSTVLFKEGVPNVELGPAVEKMKGPLFVNGVGDTSVKVNSEYMCSIQLVDGTRSILEGVTVDRISSPIPYAKLGAAEEQIKASDLENAELQSLQCNPEVGGELDILMGIQYSALFPTPVHSLPSGLTIYKLTVSSYDSKYNAVIGGPHESFVRVANYFGGLGLNFVVQLQKELEDFRQFGPPSVTRTLSVEYQENRETAVEEITENYVEEIKDPVEKEKVVSEEEQKSEDNDDESLSKEEKNEINLELNLGYHSTQKKEIHKHCSKLVDFLLIALLLVTLTVMSVLSLGFVIKLTKGLEVQGLEAKNPDPFLKMKDYNRYKDEAEEYLSRDLCEAQEKLKLQSKELKDALQQGKLATSEYNEVLDKLFELRQQKRKLARQVRDKEKEMVISLQKINNLHQDIRKAEKMRMELEVMTGRVAAMYQDSDEEFAVKRPPERAVRSPIKLFDVDEKLWTKDLYDVEEIIDNIEKEELGDSSTEDEDEFDGVADRSRDEREEYEQMLDFTIPAASLDTDLTALISAVNVELESESESTEPLHQWSSVV